MSGGYSRGYYIPPRRSVLGAGRGTGMWVGNFSQDDLYTMVEANAKNLQDRAFLYTIYLTGSRISEVVRNITTDQIDVISLKGKAFVVFTQLEVLKKRKPERRSVYINYLKEKRFVDPVLLWVRKREMEGFKVLFPFSSRYGVKIAARVLGMFPHWLRGLRATHLIKYYKFNAYELNQFFRWSRMDSSMKYVGIMSQDLALKMM